MLSTKNLYKGLIWIWKKFLEDVIKILLLICKRTFCNLLEKMVVNAAITPNEHLFHLKN